MKRRRDRQSGTRPSADPDPIGSSRVPPVAQPARSFGVIRALLPVRFFFGATFLYAGFDKLLDPRFFDATSPASIQAQMIVFTRVSPIASLVRLGQPLAVPIGLGALTGLAYRAVAWAGASLSLVFFLTASWATRPFYYGPDLPYAAGWIALALAGHGGLIVSQRLLAWASGTAGDAVTRGAALGAHGRVASRRRRGGPVDANPAGDGIPLRDRRTVLQAGVLGLFALVAASLAVPFRGAGAVTLGGPAGSDAGDGSSAGTSTAPSSGTPSASAVAASPSAVAGLTVAHVGELAKTGARAFTVPFSAPAPLPAGDPAVIVKLADGSYVAFDAVCTHAGCTVQWDRTDRVLLCPCHDAAFDPAHGAAVLQGPTNQPLASISIVVDAASGAISLRA